ncbi:alpha/beta hydrolase family protein [Amycolatopsis sulphurea]|uniref:Alpha/beta hydrolase family protein n=1 Tax=Amycolatopsis sulphurea TaxID=76022 RepID=A0A2A9G2P0_9PSEU|nr:alpha/beta hydrolase [Amycolatopsis sulphurea]PFG57122.1 alpha/beta hydrolase family protein [Amycolatopsis sulphurea]
MVTWAQVRQWQPGPLQDAVGRLNASYNKLVACSDDLRGITTADGWHGDTASAASAAANKIIDDLEEYAAELAAGRRSFGETGDAITGVVNGVKEAEGLASAHNFAIAADGAIVDNGPTLCVPEDQKDAVAQERQTIAAELRDRVEEVIRQATDIDTDFCAVLDRILSGHTIDATGNDNQHTSLAAAGDSGFALGGLSVLAPPPVDAAPSMNAAWWAALSPNQRAALIRDHPDMVGNRDGIKAADRSKANLNLMDRERQSFTAELDRLKREDGDSDEIARIEERLKALNAITAMMHNPDGTLNTDRQLMSLDMTGDHPKAAIANGDVDTAQHVAVFTPGMNSTVDGNMHGYVEDMQGVRNSAQDMLLKNNTPASVATVTWLGYEPSSFDDPGSLFGLASGDNSSFGGDKLAKFDQGINAARPADPHMTALGHSQGSLVTGISLSHSGTGVDDAVFFGSPGISENFGIDNTAHDLKIPEGHAYNLRADGDDVATWAPETWRYGRAPYDMPGMQQLSADSATSADGSQYASSHGHSEYTKTMPDGTDSTSKHNIAAIVAGMPQLAIAAR